MHRTGPQRALDRAAVRITWARAQHVVLPAGGRVGGEPGADAPDRRAVFADSVLRQPQALRGAGRQSQARAAADAGHRDDYHKRRTTWPGAGHKIYPYLLRNVAITRPDQAWAGDITYVPLRHGYLYLVAAMDWYSRHVLSWRLSNTLTGSFCLEALDEALSRSQPKIFNSDQGSQFTAAAFTSRLESCGVAVSMDGRGRAIDNVSIEPAVSERSGSVLARLHGRMARRSVTGGVLPPLRRENSPVARLPHAGRGLSPPRLKRRATAGRKTN
jgi:transposase InsO family protein